MIMMTASLTALLPVTMEVQLVDCTRDTDNLDMLEVTMEAIIVTTTIITNTTDTALEVGVEAAVLMIRIAIRWCRMNIGLANGARLDTNDSFELVCAFRNFVMGFFGGH